MKPCTLYPPSSKCQKTGFIFKFLSPSKKKREGGGGNLTNVQCKAIQKWYSDSLCNEYMITKMGKKVYSLMRKVKNR
jgi:hypothetical protein